MKIKTNKQKTVRQNIPRQNRPPPLKKKFLLGIGPALGHGWSTQWHHIWRNFMVTNGSLHPFPFRAEILSGFDLCWSCASAVVWWQFLCPLVLLCLEDIVSFQRWGAPSPLALQIFSPPLLHVSLSLDGRALMETSYLGSSAQKFLMFVTSSCESLYWSPPCQKRLLWWGLIDALTYIQEWNLFTKSFLGNPKSRWLIDLDYPEGGPPSVTVVWLTWITLSYLARWASTSWLVIFFPAM